ncbi:unnamed protein product [Phytomonas sp. Hart1]|nr:unnamed protein product [Phytomonas sp. Hart1]|eukprot:CCW67875.1 unnamed protein product [Phytomonas sp. isolate Hart1]
MLCRRTMTGVRDIMRGGSLLRRVIDLSTKKVSPESFTLESVISEACTVADVALPQNPETQLENYRYWKKLCKACAEKTTSNYGGKLLRARLVTALSQRFAVDEIFRLNGNEIEKESITKPLIVMGIPRSNGHFAAHVLSRSGLFLAPRQYDTLSPSLMVESQRMREFNKRYVGFQSINPDFRCVRLLKANQIDDDLTLHLMTPQCYAWGLLHGLDEYLLECLDEDQTPVYMNLKRTLQLFQWLRKCGHFSDPVVREHEPIDNPLETQAYGTKNSIIRPQYILYSPFAILSSDAINETFPDMLAIWVHRALAQCIPSLCSSLCLHNSLYTGKPPTDSQLASMGEKVLGIFGSGTEYAIEYYGKFDQKRMAHWSNRDLKRHATRLAGKTLDYFGINLDRYRRMQMIDGQTEYIENFRPMHDSQMNYFCLHEGIIGDVFNSYIFQFEEFAFEKRLGVVVQEYNPLASARDSLSMRSMKIDDTEDKIGKAFTSNQPMTGHFLQESKGFR